MKRRRAELAFGLAALACGVFLCVWGSVRPVDAQQVPPQAPEGSATTGAPPAGAPVAPTTPAPLPETVRIVFTTVPSTKAMVFWGKKRLGPIAPRRPLIVHRPRDSGPLDLMVRAEGFLPVQTRVYTFGDGKIAVKLTALDQKKTLLGYREPPPPDGGIPLGVAAPDGGVLPESPPTP